VQEVRQDLLSALEALVADEYGFEVKDHMLQFYGVCAECKPKSRKSR
jgi:Fur family ferric uptake transcriptional regulator